MRHVSDVDHASPTPAHPCVVFHLPAMSPVEPCYPRVHSTCAPEWRCAFQPRYLGTLSTHVPAKAAPTWIDKQAVSDFCRTRISTRPRHLRVFGPIILPATIALELWNPRGCPPRALPGIQFPLALILTRLRCVRLLAPIHLPGMAPEEM